KVNDEAISSLFHAVKGMDAKLKEGGVFISLTAMGGKLGLDAEVNPVSGAVSGFTKGVKREYTASDVLVLDLPVGIGVEGGLKRLAVELGDGDRPLEYGWDGKNRYIPAMRIMEHSQEQINHLEDGMRILISGGGTGITAEIVKELAKSARLELHLLGRTQISGDVERLSDLDDEGLKKEKELLKERLKDEGRKVTPVLLEREFSSITKSIAIHKMLSDVKSSGSEVFYHSLDVTDAKGIKKMVKKAGKFDGIIHGAGVEQSKLISAKKKEDFDRVYNTKVMGAHALIMATKDHPLKFFISFTSVAGRFGNGGQVDYSAANDLLDKLHGAVTSIHPDCLVKAVGWSAWADVGMASRGSVKTILEIGGITFIPVEDGVRYGVDEILYGDEREVYYSGSLGPMDSEKLMRWEEGVHKAPSIQEKGYAPLLDSMIEEGDGFALYERRLDGVRERFLPDHSIMGTMVMPGVMGMEVFAEAASRLLPDKEFLGLESVSFRKPVNIKGSTTFRVSAKIEGEKKGVTRISLDLVSDDPRKEGKKIEHYVGTALMGSREGVKHRIEGHPLRPGSVQARILRDEIYKHMFHGDRFRVLSGIDVLKEGELLGTYNRVPDDLFDPSTSFTPGDLISVPMQSEAGFQAAGAYVMDRFHMMALPTKVERLTVHRWMRSDELASVWVRFIENVDNTYTFDFDILDVDGNVTVSVGGYELKALMPFQEGFEGDHSLKFEELEGPFEGVRVFRIEVGSLKAEHESYRRYFSDKEWSSITWEKMADKRKLEHLAGRVISKLALTWVEATDKGVSLPLSSATIIVSQGGKPSGLIGGDGRNISISHSRRWAICSVSERVHGIDLELAEPRDPSFDEEAFTKEEMELLGSVLKDLSISPEEAKTLVFSAKEAVLKMFGEGLGENIRKVTGLAIKRITPTTFELTMKFGREHLVQTYMVGAYVLSLCGED
ncbi:MAG: SDR family NAD(P)-dependent oxidoreductase, partial [Thermoplasmata archaeon]|nr:SDR family NAD(P)-dependent oxidoreductase [Thermoplasmata archaeon]